MKTESLLKAIDDKISSYFLDVGRPCDSIILAGMGRSGTTWAGNIINYDNRYRVLFEPFFPAKVEQAREFENNRYINRNCKNTTLASQAKLILAGKIRNSWVDRDVNRRFYRRRIIKDVRCNLMLGWLKELADLPTVLMIRYPLQVAASWSKLGWGKKEGRVRADFDNLTSEEALLRDFPLIRDVMKWIDRQDFVECVVFRWCIQYLIPLNHLKNGEAHALFYENLLMDPENETAKLFHYLDKPFNRDKVHRAMRDSSSTNFLGRDFKKDQSRLLKSWNDEFSTKQVQRANSILAAFGLDDIYDEDGCPTGAHVFRDNSTNI